MKNLLCGLVGVLFLAVAPVSVFADKADVLLKEEMQKHPIAGLALAVVKDGKPVKIKGYGVANIEWNVPVTKDTVFEIGSISKQFTAACILLLVQEGKLSLDDKISAHLKNTPDSWANITVRHLLTHTSGLKNYTVLDGFELRNHLTQEEWIKKLAAQPLNFQPGDSWAYCNSGFNLLGYIIENVSGQSYWDFLGQRILQPLGMTSTRNRTPGVIITNRAAGYELTKQKVPINRDYDLTELFAAGAITSTLVDMMKWDTALDGDKLLTTASKELWWTPVKLNNGKTHDYGFGWFLSPAGAHRNIWHGGQTSGFSCANQRFPDEHICIIILTNADEDDLANKMARAIAPFYLPKAVAAK